jgi:3-deoxy-manno-octulosonate cytidylyltransferase (CMP-KDO synthetase)
MKIVGIIPARYKSTRFPGKPLADICGRPMIWWVYQQVKKVTEFNAVYVATDSEQIQEACEKFNIAVIMTGETCGTSTERLYEVSQKIQADYYVCINGDEPLISPEVIRAVLPKQPGLEIFFVCNLITKIKDPVELMDFSNIKVVTDENGYALFMSRSPIPAPKASLNYAYYKHIGVLVYNPKALEFFANTPKGKNELIEDINELRFIEHNVKLKMLEVQADTLSVDTYKDLEKIRSVIQNKISNGVLPPPPPQLIRRE